MTDPKAEFERLLAELRPRLHRYCARMTGSVIDGEAARVVVGAVDGGMGSTVGVRPSHQ